MKFSYIQRGGLTVMLFGGAVLLSGCDFNEGGSATLNVPDRPAIVAKSSSYTSTIATTTDDHWLAYKWNRWGEPGGWAKAGTGMIAQVQYAARVEDEKGNTIANNSSVSVGDVLRFKSAPFSNTDISWFMNGFGLDSPYGKWGDRTNGGSVDCPSSEFIGTTDLSGTIYASFAAKLDFYMPFIVDKPAVSISHIGSTAGLSCNSDGSQCTVTSAGTIVTKMTFSSTMGRFYYRYWDYRDLSSTGNGGPGCYGNNYPLRTITDPSLCNDLIGCTESNVATVPFEYVIPTQTIPLSLTAASSCAANQGQSCSGPKNSCGQSYSGVYNCDGICSGAPGYDVYGPEQEGKKTNTCKVSTKGCWSDGFGFGPANGTYTCTAAWSGWSWSEWDNVDYYRDATCSDVIWGAPPESDCTPPPTPTAGKCDPATNGKSFSSQPSNLCSSGTDSGVTTLPACDASASSDPSCSAGPFSSTLSCSTSVFDPSLWSSYDDTSCSEYVEAYAPSDCFTSSSALCTTNPSVTQWTWTCSGSSTASCSAGLTAAIPAPTATLTASPSSITSGNSSTLTVTGNNGATGCWLSGGGLFEWISPASGTKVVSPTSTTAYSTYCWNTSGSGSSVGATVTVTPPSAPAVDLKVNNSDGPVTLPYLADKELKWTVSNATSCNASGIDGFANAKDPSGGPETLQVHTSSLDTITCTGPGGTTADSVQIKCQQAATVWDAFGQCDCSTEKKTRTGTNTNCDPVAQTIDCTTTEKNGCRDFNWKEVTP